MVRLIIITATPIAIPRINNSIENLGILPAMLMLVALLVVATLMLNVGIVLLPTIILVVEDVLLVVVEILVGIPDLPRTQRT